MKTKLCAKCGRARLTKFFWKNPRMASGLASYCVDCAGEVNRASSKKYLKTRKRLELNRRVKRYGLTVEQFERLYAEQGGTCFLCKRPEQERSRLAVDHDHATGVVRGLLCTRCNAGLGSFQDDPARLRFAATYLEKTRVIH